MTESKIYAGFFRRVLAWFIDLVILMVFSMSLALSIGFVVIFSCLALRLPEALQTQIVESIGTVVGFTVVILYFTMFESSSWMATPGKRVTGLIVTDMTGNRISYGRAVARLFGKFLSGFLFCLGYLVCLITEHKQTLHDIIAHTLVWKVVKKVDSPK
jgi:uncharacterized RDD family membrane protein YckC